MPLIALAGSFLTQSPPPTELDGDQVLTWYWIDPIDAADRMVDDRNSLIVFIFTMNGRNQSKDQLSVRLDAQIQVWYFRRPSS
jgi:hypothetical protein